RLITLISAGRNRTIVIRRELPRTKDASSGSRPYRIKRRRVLLTVSPSPATGAAARRYKGLFSGSLLLRLWFGFDGNGPSETQQFTGNGSDDLGFVLAVRGEFLIACTQTPLRLPGNIFDFLIEALLAFEQKATHPRLMLIGPGGFHHHAAQMRIAGFGNAAPLDTVAAGVLTRDQAAVAHQLAGILKTAQRPSFGHDGDCRHLCDAAQSLQRRHDGTDLFRSFSNRLVDGFL